MKPYYERGGITIYHGDCREILPTLQTDEIDLVLTDPPYGIGINHNAKQVGTATHKSRKATDLIWDDAIPDAFCFTETMRVSKNQIVFGANYYWQYFYSTQCYIIWDKRGTLPAVPFCDTEFAWTSFVGRMPKRYIVINHGFIRDSKDIREHPTQKPLELFRTILTDFSADGQSILDPFMGSGTTLRAAKDLGRRAIGIEIEEKYCEIAARRLSQEVMAL